MKQVFIAIYLCTFSLVVVAQDATLTKGETVEYLKKKLKECEDYKDNNGQLHNFYLSFEGENLTINFTSVFAECETQQKFNPADIQTVLFAEFTSGLSIMKIYLSSASAKRVVKCHKGSSSDEGATNERWVYFYFLTKDGKNKAKVEKAILHLKALLEAEDDPFGK